VFPKDSPRNMRFAINFFTSIGLGGEGGAGWCVVFGWLASGLLGKQRWLAVRVFAGSHWR
jgi:hypothetical protein